MKMPNKMPEYTHQMALQDAIENLTCRICFGYPSPTGVVTAEESPKIVGDSYVSAVAIEYVGREDIEVKTMSFPIQEVEKEVKRLLKENENAY